MSLNDTTNEVPYGYCHCGCGQLTKLAPYSSKRLGWIKDEPIRYINGHYSPPANERFWAKVDKSGECWEWTGTRQYSGYGVLRIHGKSIRAHRFAWELENGPIPPGMVVMHICDNPRCVRHSHLKLGTQIENVGDRGSKNRQSRGATNSRAKLTEADVTEIRRRFAHEHITKESLAADYGVDGSTIGAIVLRKTWRHVP